MYSDPRVLLSSREMGTGEDAREERRAEKSFAMQKRDTSPR